VEDRSCGKASRWSLRRSVMRPRSRHDEAPWRQLSTGQSTDSVASMKDGEAWRVHGVVVTNGLGVGEAGATGEGGSTWWRSSTSVWLRRTMSRWRDAIK
jgi:hypothetical protein